MALSGNGVGASPLTKSSAAKPNLTLVSEPTGTTISRTKAFTSQLAQSDSALLHLTGTAPTAVMVKLDYDPLATYNGYLAGLPATSPQVTGKKLDVRSPAAVAYSGHISAVEQSFLSSLHQSVPTAKVGQTYHTVYGGMALRVPANQVASLLQLPGAVAVQTDSLHKFDAVTPVAEDDAEFIGGNAAYSALGSNATAGAGVIVANVDTGVWPEHPSFAARPDLGTPSPTPDSHARACNFGTNPLPGGTLFTCNSKLIGGQVFLATYNALIGDEPYPTSARDSEGHGTHTLSTAAGNPLTSAPVFGIDRGPIQGIAPGAFVMAYKALGPQGGFDSDLVAAIEQAILDGANVINYSVGPSSPQSAYTSPDDLAFLDAFDAGVFVSTSAGNSGPGAGTTSHLGPWETTVGASTLQRAFVSTATLTATGGATLSVQGSSIMPGITSPTPVVNATSLAGYSAGCSTAAPAGSFTGKIVVCVRGGVGRIQKGVNVRAGGAAGMFLINPVVQDTETDNHFLPAVHFDHPAGAQIETFLSGHSGVAATTTTGQELDGQGDVMASFSSRGPGGDFLKPDIVAPGVQILAGNTPTPDGVASGPPGQYFQAIAGTSMAAPHIAGSAALTLALHPSFSVSEVKSALMTTANRNVVLSDGVTAAGVFDDGSGRVALGGVIDPGLALDVSRANMDAVLTDSIHRIDLNEPSVYDAALPGTVTTTRTFTNVSGAAQAYQVSVTADLPGSITVSPSVLSVPSGATRTLTVTLDGTGGTIGTFYTGQINLAQLGGSRQLHLPVAFSPSAASAAPVSLKTSCGPSIIHLTTLQESTCTATAQNNALQPATVNMSTTWDDNLTFRSATGGATRTGSKTVTAPAQTLAAAQPPNPQVVPGTSPGFFDLGTLQPPPRLRAVGDDTITTFNVPGFVYDGVTYTKLGVASNGYLVAGGGDSNDISATPQHFPNPVRPNNVLAPLWTDLDGGSSTATGQGLRIGVVTDGTSNWIVVQLKEHVFGTTTLESFEVWIGIDGTQDISYTYETVNNPGIAFNVGAENAEGTAGSNVAGLPSPAQDLVVNSVPGVPGGSFSYSVTLRGNRVLPGTPTPLSNVTTSMSTSISRDTAVSTSTIQVVR